MSSPFDMITQPYHAAGKSGSCRTKPDGTYPAAGWAERTHHAGAEPDSGQKRSTAPNDGAELSQRAWHRLEPVGKRPEFDASEVRRLYNG